MIETIKGWYQTAWDWSYNAGSIVMARLTAIAGILTSAVSFMDWSPLFALLGVDTGFTTNQAFWLGAALFVKGIFDEIVRRSNTVVTEAAKLLPKDITTPEVKAVKKKQAKK